MAFGYTGGDTDAGTGTSATAAHGQTINSGNLVVAYLNYNHASGSITPNETWDGSNVETPASETAQQAFYWQIADGSEPSTYTFALGNSAEWRLIIGVFTSSTDAEVDAVFSTFRNGIGLSDISCEDLSGISISDNCLSIVAGGKDTRGTAEAYTTADNSYSVVAGDVSSQAAAMAYRVHGTSATMPATVLIETADGNDGKSDRTYRTHISFVESAGGGGATIPVGFKQTNIFRHMIGR